jgi:ABC-type transport system involved in resistance to organic solvents, ATPase component
MIDLKNISLSLTGRLILNDISLHIEKSSTSVILGSSGAGKSTILKIILGLLRPDYGQVIIDGIDISGKKENDILNIRRKMGIVFQGNALFDSLTVEENTAFFLKEKDYISQSEIKNKVEEVLSFVNLSGTENLYTDQLSGGMKKRLAIARALALDPQIFLFDEPTTGLDPINSKAVLSLIQKLKERGVTSVIVTHILNDAIAIGDVLTVIDEGSVIENGSISQILKSDSKFIKEFFYEIFQENMFIKNNKQNGIV